jgi:MoxR-like ATPase
MDFNLGSNKITDSELMTCNEIIRLLMKYYSDRIVGQEKLGKALLITLMTNNHILLESVPGLAKTTAAKVMTDAVCGKFSRIQCTPDLLPSDIVGTQIFNQANNTFETKQGPVFANFVLLDEINRSSAKTQSAMLEAMQERQVTIGGALYALPEIFMVIATQNPIEQEGTYLLAEAQLDRFLLKEKLNYPGIIEEIEILNRIENNIFLDTQAILPLKEIIFLQDVTKDVYLSNAMKEYIVKLVQATREPEKIISKELASYITLGSSTRGAIAFMEASKALALINRKDICNTR